MFVKRMLCIIMVGIIIGCMIPASAFAVDPIPFEIAEQAGAIIYDLYGAANNTSLAFDSIEPGPALTEIITLFQESQAATGGEPISMTAIGTALLAAGAIAVVYDASDAVYNLVIDLDYDSFGEFYQDFNQGWDYILSDVAGFIRDSTDGLFHWSYNNGVVTPTHIYNYNSLFINGYRLQELPVQLFVSYSNGQETVSVFDYNNYSIDPIYAFNAVYDNTYRLFFVTTSQTINYGRDWTSTLNGQTTYEHNDLSYSTSDYGGGYRYYFLGTYNSTTVSNIPSYNSPVGLTTNIADILGVYQSSSLEPGGISIEPNPLFIGDPLRNPLEITIPNPSSPMPQNQPIRIGTDIVIDPGLIPDSVPTNPTPGVAYPITDPDCLTEIIPEVWDDIVTGDVTVDPDPSIDIDPAPEPAPDDPNPDLNLNPEDVVIPYIPIKLPSFRFNFRSIWHYVRDWVASLAQFFKLISLVWSRLPYPIVLPIYATLVIVIVIGVWRRFVS